MRHALLGVLAVFGVALFLGVATRDFSPPQAPVSQRMPLAYNYDGPAALTIIWTDAHNGPFVAYDDPAERSRVALTFSGPRLAAEGGGWLAKKMAAATYADIVRTRVRRSVTKWTLEHTDQLQTLSDLADNYHHMVDPVIETVRKHLGG